MRTGGREGGHECRAAEASKQGGESSTHQAHSWNGAGGCERVRCCLCLPSLTFRDAAQFASMLLVGRIVCVCAQGRGWMAGLCLFHISLACRFDSLEALEAHIKTCPAEEKAALLAELNEMATKALERAAPRSGKSLWGRAKVMIPVCANLCHLALLISLAWRAATPRF